MITCAIFVICATNVLKLGRHYEALELVDEILVAVMVTKPEVKQYD